MIAQHHHHRDVHWHDPPQMLERARDLAYIAGDDHRIDTIDDLLSWSEGRRENLNLHAFALQSCFRSSVASFVATSQTFPNRPDGAVRG
ncbi:hypothetical protein ACVW1B_005351 [Bradyrhizobium sp. USDA 4502]